ncbi:MAG: benzoyl-CoA reductase subunit B [Candidatus Krumholzibacteria bacterium]|nr:benzoyl-CoA reductase subunit B [Candidatus Krumholzibacteria bacterium]
MTRDATVQKEQSMVLQKDMIAAHFKRLANAKETGKKVVYTFVPGNLNELIWAFDMLPVHPEINALQSAMRKKSSSYVIEAEKFGHSEDVCTYVKCDIGMLKKGNIGPTGEKLPEPDLLLLSYTGCFTFMKWFELLKQEYDCPVAMLHVPYQADGEKTPEMIEYVSKQLREEVVPLMEKVSGNKLDKGRLRMLMESSARAEENLVAVWESAKNKPSPIDAYFGGVYYIGPIFSAFRGLDVAEEYYRTLREEVDARVEHKLGPITPDGPMKDERYRLVVEGPPNWTSFREFWKMFYDEGAVVVSSSYTKVGGIYDNGFRHDPDRPFQSMAEYCTGCYTNLNLPTRIQYLQQAIDDYHADGFLINSIKSCNSFSAGQLLILRELEKRTGKAGGFIESDLVDPRYFSAANIKNRLESYFQMIDAKRNG